MGDRADSAVRWASRALEDGALVGTTASQVVVEWRGIGRLLTSASGESPEFHPAVGVKGSALDKFRATSLLACRRYLAGAMSLHGSAVRLAGGAILFVGDKGAGKSTTAMALVERGRGEFLADDVVPIDWVRATPVVPPVDDSFWLTEDASGWFGRPSRYEGKRPHPPRARAGRPEPLRGIVELVFDESLDRLDLQPMSGQEAFLLLSRAQICYPTGAEGEVIRDLESRARLGRAARAFRLRRPRRFDTLEAVEQVLSGCLSDVEVSR
jgi:hypothetical protein